ncbi:uncharacterized protein METZ01_LOCUS447279, partial [marine metagenome]
GPLTYGSKEEQVFLGRDMANQKNFSDETAKLIDQEVKNLVMGGYKKAHEIITTHRDSLEKMALALLDRETLNASEIKEIINGKTPPSGGQEVKKESPTNSTTEIRNKTDEDSGDIMGDGLPDPHPA